MRCPRYLRAVLTGLATFVVGAFYVRIMLYEPSYSKEPRLMHLIAFTILYLAHFVSFWQVIRTDPGRVPSMKTHPHPRFHKASRRWMPRKSLVFERKRNGHERYCRKCELLKPDRAHHCLSCEKCCLRMDHCCGFLGVCVGYLNHKFFLLYM